MTKAPRITLFITTLLGLAASTQLMLERLRTLADSDYIPSCSLNPILSCGTVMDSWQATVFGFPNIIGGLIAFGIAAGIFLVLLFARTLPHPIWMLSTIGTAFGAVFSMWLMTQSLYDIEKLCLYCMIVWLACIILFTHTFLYSLATERLIAHEKAQAIGTQLYKFRWFIIAVWIAIVIALIILRFPTVLAF